MNTNRMKLIGIVLFIIILFAGGGYRLYLQNQNSLISTGTIEVTQVDITAKTYGYLKELKIKEGDTVTKGQVIATLDREDLKAQLEKNKASLLRVKTQLTDLEKGARFEELQQATANTKAALSIYEKSKKDYARSEQLYASGAISKQTLDLARTDFEVTENSLIATREKEILLNKGEREDVILAQKMSVKEAEESVKIAQIAVDDITILSPLNGVVLTKNFELGEYINTSNAIATVADPTDCWVKVYIPSTDLALIKLGQEVKVKIDAFPDKTFNGYIKEISDSAEYTPRQSITRNERANLVFKIKVQLNNDEGILKPGMPADVMFYD